MPTISEARTALRNHFGFTEFREGQGDVIQAVLAGRDVVVVMPTGSGKSLCYQLPALMLEGATVVVSPLIALMKDQVEALQARNLPATFINSAIGEQEQRGRIEKLRRGQFKLVYVAPERFRSSRFVEALRSIRVSLFAVDEAHCISTWGHDFRPDYLRLKNAIHLFPGVKTLALTATATPYVRSDIVQQLGLERPDTFVSGFDRPNLSLDVVHTAKERQKLAVIKQLAKTHTGSGIIYTATRKAVTQVALDLQMQGLSVAGYHAGLSDGERARAQEDFMAGRVQMIVATNAFGMGIDKPDIRFVAHYQMPGSIEAYYQEIGRAGRDGLPSTCALLFNYADKNTHDFFIEGSYPSFETVELVYDGLVKLKQRQIELSISEIALLTGVSNELAVQSSLYLLERAGHLERGLSYRRANVGDVPPWEAPTGRESQAKPRRIRGVVMLDEAPTKLRINPADVLRRAGLERRKLREMLDFCYAQTCYRAYILNYFGDRHHARACGTCGNCDLRLRLDPSTGRGSKATGRAVARSLTPDETLRVRKILACAKRMNGRFGKQMLVATLRGSAARKVIGAGLHQLSTYGLLREMTAAQLQTLIDALVLADCLRVSRGEYPTVSITALGERVMREQEEIKLAL